MKKYYDKVNNRLVFVGRSCGNTYWDKHWESEDFASLIKLKNNRFIIKNTQRYLSPGAKILEGGCGRGDKVYLLSLHGFDAYGVDYAKDTVEKINRYVPELKITVGDVRNLQFRDGFFDGYWSLGVIEHFYYGYDSILREAHRVLSKGGYLFLTAPVISWLRRQKVRIRKYLEYYESEDMKKHFYQFAFETQELLKQFRVRGFELIGLAPISGLKGLKDEVSLFQPFLQLVCDNNSLIAKIIKKAIDLIASPFANHMAFFILKKIKSPEQV